MGCDEVVLLEDAEQDMLDGKAFYNGQQEGLGSYYWQCLVSDLESLKIYAGVHVRVYGLYRMKSKRFPYLIYYEVSDNSVYVVAVLAMRSKPESTFKSLAKRRS